MNNEQQYLKLSGTGVMFAKGDALSLIYDPTSGHNLKINHDSFAGFTYVIIDSKNDYTFEQIIVDTATFRMEFVSSNLVTKKNEKESLSSNR